ncbi:MAG: membrane integrity-associated transporter subunit PqiC [Rhodocyclales bacterium]|nr:membrane integrity-associated transporter subunit PqiC [Rhodocyclales bacterium]
MKAGFQLIAASLIAALGLAGCLGSAPTTRFYQLQSVIDKPATHTAQESPTLLVREVRLPHYLDRPQIVTREAGNRLQLAEFDRWGGDLREDMTRVLIQNLGRVLGGKQVFAAPLGVVVQPDYRLEVEVLRFERDGGGQVRLHARWWLTRGSDLNLLATHESWFSGSSASGSYPDLVATMNSVYAELASVIATNIRKLDGT